MRRDVLAPKNQGIPQPPPGGGQPFGVMLMNRLLTEDHPAGKPSLKQERITGTRDLIKMKPVETVTVEDENGAQVPHRIAYGRQCVTGQDLVENTSPDRVLTLAVPVAPTVPHEPGLPMRLGYEIQALNALEIALDDDLVTIPEDFGQGCQDEEARLQQWLDLIEHLETRFYQSK